ncbi:hypothetical protein P43SY_001620 [Pythium insidiosum]|uniref:Uncharacterized protein n=1 Tax=Pythium insidiosum TaxID=114742 RepID=A0AAD5M773_PYTIN|nr:hypothetical protein P43SY_001620 [Pythium insidiosum]
MLLPPSARTPPVSDLDVTEVVSFQLSSTFGQPSQPDEPDLSQRKLEHKNEKCQYYNCPNRARVSQAYGKFCNRHVIVAPCGFPGCRDKAMTNTSMCEKHLAEGKEALHRVLAARAQNVPVCRVG